MPSKKTASEVKKISKHFTEPRTSSQTDNSLSSANSSDSVKPRKSRSDRAGVTFPVGRIHKELKKGRYANRIGAGAPVYLAGVLDYLVSEVTEIAGQAAKDNNKKRITPRHLTLAIRKDDELDELLSDVTIAHGGVMPSIHASLLPEASAKINNKDKNKGVKKKKLEEMQIDQNEE